MAKVNAHHGSKIRWFPVRPSRPKKEEERREY